MRLSRFELIKDSKERLGVEMNEAILDILKLADHLNQHVPKTMDELLINIPKGLSELEVIMEKANEFNFPLKNYLIQKSNIHYLPLIKKPEKILAVGMNYVEHIKARDGDVPTSPIIFNVLPNSLAAHKQNIPLPQTAQQVDYEGELVIIIGKEIKNACKKVAQEAILGYSIGNDLTDRSHQFQTSQWLIGKTFDYFSPVGPVLVTKDEIEDVQNLSIVTKRNDTVVQNGSTKDMLFSVVDIVSYTSQYMTLKPGDMIFTGTLQGVINENKVNPQWLKPNETIEVMIEDIGELSNTLV
ncbi:hypothetical protein GCM10008932_18470 [Alkalibacterium iburiense]|uniref:Fumarylacetoacetase-like C-terminal domain-containing protein n=1 Tax=Alkalibacterium iburiense TaxID=290589 RepID=A0ABP3HD68_9LACT